MSAVQDTLTHQAFTPGPWRIEPHAKFGVTNMYWVNDVTSVGTRVEADVRLIAAAPELYEALDLAYRGGMVDMAGSDFRDRVEAILAKVRGS